MDYQEGMDQIFGESGRKTKGEMLDTINAQLRDNEAFIVEIQIAKVKYIFKIIDPNYRRITKLTDEAFR